MLYIFFNGNNVGPIVIIKGSTGSSGPCIGVNNTRIPNIIIIGPTIGPKRVINNGPITGASANIGPKIGSIGPNFGTISNKIGPITLGNWVMIGPSRPKIGPKMGIRTGSNIGPISKSNIGNIGPKTGARRNKGPKMGNTGLSFGNICEIMTPIVLAKPPNWGPTCSKAGSNIGPSSKGNSNGNRGPRTGANKSRERIGPNFGPVCAKIDPSICGKEPKIGPKAGSIIGPKIKGNSNGNIGPKTGASKSNGSIGPSFGPICPKSIGNLFSIGFSEPKIGARTGPNAGNNTGLRRSISNIGKRGPRIGANIRRGPKTGIKRPSFGPICPNIGPSAGLILYKIGPKIGAKWGITRGPSIKSSIGNRGKRCGSNNGKRSGPIVGSREPKTGAKCPNINLRGPKRGPKIGPRIGPKTGPSSGPKIGNITGPSINKIGSIGSKSGTMIGNKWGPNIGNNRGPNSTNKGAIGWSGPKRGRKLGRIKGAKAPINGSKRGLIPGINTVVNKSIGSKIGSIGISGANTSPSIGERGLIRSSNKGPIITGRRGPRTGPKIGNIIKIIGNREARGPNKGPTRGASGPRILPKTGNITGIRKVSKSGPNGPAMGEASIGNKIGPNRRMGTKGANKGSRGIKIGFRASNTGTNGATRGWSNGNNGVNNVWTGFGSIGNKAGSNSGSKIGNSGLKTSTRGTNKAGTSNCPNIGKSGFKCFKNGFTGESSLASGANKGNKGTNNGFIGDGMCGINKGNKTGARRGKIGPKNDISGNSNKGIKPWANKGNKGTSGLSAGLSGSSNFKKGANIGIIGAKRGCIGGGKCGKRAGINNGAKIGKNAPSTVIIIGRIIGKTKGANKGKIGPSLSSSGCSGLIIGKIGPIKVISGARKGCIIGGKCGSNDGSKMRITIGSRGPNNPSNGKSNSGRAKWPNNGKIGVSGASNGLNGVNFASIGANTGKILSNKGFNGAGKWGTRAGSSNVIVIGFRWGSKNPRTGASSKGTKSCPNRGNKGVKGARSGCKGARGPNNGATRGISGANKDWTGFGKCGAMTGSRKGPNTGTKGPKSKAIGKISNGPKGPKIGINAGKICGSNNTSGKICFGARACRTAVTTGVRINATPGIIARATGPIGIHTGIKATNPSTIRINWNTVGTADGKKCLKRSKIVTEIIKVGSDKLLPNRCSISPCLSNNRDTNRKPIGPIAGRTINNGSIRGTIPRSFGIASNGRSPTFTNWATIGSILCTIPLSTSFRIRVTGDRCGAISGKTAIKSNPRGPIADIPTSRSGINNGASFNGNGSEGFSTTVVDATTSWPVKLLFVYIFNLFNYLLPVAWNKLKLNKIVTTRKNFVTIILTMSQLFNFTFS